MRIVFDARTIRQGMTGVGRYAAALAQHLPMARPKDEFLFLILRGQIEALGHQPFFESKPNARWIEVDADYESHPRGDWWEHRILPRLLKEWNADVFHGPAYLIPFLCGKTSAARIVTLHDLSVFTFADAYPLAFRTYLRWIISRSLAAADAVICVSDFVRREALQLFPNMAESKFSVIPHAPDKIFEPANSDEKANLRNQYNLPASYLLMVGTFETRKNPGFLPRLYHALEKRLGAEQLPIFLWAGRRGHGSDTYLRELELLQQKGLFQLRENASDAELLALYQCADLLVYPSLYEGFGLPVLEAMACGLPVVAADTSSLKEAAGAGGACISLNAVDKWADKITELLRDPKVRNESAQTALQHAAEFTWSRAAIETAKVYDSKTSRAL